MDVCFQDPRSKILWRIRSRNSLQKFEGVTNCTRGVVSYLRPLLNILHFGPSLSRCDVGFQRRDVSTSRRQFDPSLVRRDVGLDPLWNVATLDPNVVTSFFVLLWNVVTLDPNIVTSFFVLLWNVATLDLNVVTLVLTTLWNVATLDLNVATLAAFLSGTSRRCICTSRRCPI